MWLLAFLVLLSAISVYGPKVDQLRESVTNQEHRAFIKCHVLLGTPAVEVHRMLDKIARSRALSKTHVYRLYNEFKDGSHLSSKEDPRSGRPRTATDTTHEERLRELLNEGECWRTEDLAQILNISTASTKRLLKEVGAKKVASRWVPCELKPEQKQLRVTVSAEHLERYHSNPNMLERIIAIDETWLKSYDPKDAESSKQWVLPSQKPYVF